MTTPPQPPSFQPYPVPPAPQTPRKRPRWLLPVLIGVGAVLLLCVGVGVLGAFLPDKPAASPTAKPATATAEPVTATTAPAAPTTQPTTEAPAAKTPAVKDFALRAKVTDKECFGSAGCNVTLKVQAEYGGPVLSPDDTWEVTYEVRGVEDGPQIGSFTITGDTYEVNEEYVSTKTSKSQITIKVTDVEKVGI